VKEEEQAVVWRSRCGDVVSKRDGGLVEDAG